MWTKCAWLFVTGLFFSIHPIFSDESCQVDQKPKLQIVFVVDYVLNRNNNYWIKAQTLTAFHLIDFIKRTFEAEYAVTGFVDFPDILAPRGINNPEHCYFLMEKLTTDKDKIISAISQNISGADFDNFEGDEAGSLTTAMLFSAVDKRLKWNSGYYDKQGKLVRKIMIPMVFRNVTVVLENPGHLTPPKADGTDTCETALIPKFEQLNEVLYDNQFTVVNSIVNTMKGFLKDEIYAEFFADLFVPYYQAPIPKAGAVLNPNKFDYKAYAKKVFNVIANEVMSCYFEDPISYNTLGM